MKRNFRWFRLAVLMILLLIFGTVLPGNVYAAEVKNEKEVKEEKNEKDEKDKEESYSAKVIRLLHYEGEVGIEDAEGKSAFMMENIRLSSGQALVTGPESSASVGLDDSRILSLDADTRVEFIQEKDQLELNLVKGTLFLDVQDKLDENEVLDIRTSTMAVGIRGTIVFVSVEEEGPEKQASEQKASLEDVTGTVTVGVLEGTARINSLDENGQDVYSVISAGQKATIPSNGEAAPSVRVASSGEEISKEQKLQKTGSPAVISKLEQTDLPGFVYEQIEKDDYLRQRVEESGGFLSDTPANQEDPYAADGDWTWNNRVELVAQSASKLYDGQPLTRPSDVLVYGLPEIFSIRTYASGSQTDAGTGVNYIAAYTIYNAAGEDVTRHFTNVIKTSGLLVVDPAPVTIWTDSAEKVYDGQPLTAEDAGVKLVPGYTKEQVSWRNRSYLITDKDGISYNKQVLYGLCGATAVHASNPYTGETRDIYLKAGERLTVHLHEEDESGSTIDFIVEKIAEEEVPEDILRLYADNPALLKQACQDTGWDIEILQKRIEELPPDEERKTVEQDGLQVDEKGAERLMTELTNVRLTVDTRITSYYNRALGSMEAHFTPVRINDDIKVKATGSQTDAGESQNTYEIDWGNANPANYVVNEDPGTLKVMPAPLSVTTESAAKPYDGAPLTQAQAELSGLVNGESASVTGTGTITRVGSIPNTYSIDWGTAKEGNYEIIEENLGTLKVTPAGKTLTITTGSASKTYDGSPLVSSDVTVSGLINGDRVTVTPTGSITDAGSVKNTYTIDWGDTDPNNYNIEENLGTLTVEPAKLTISTGSAEKTYDGSALKSSEAEVSGLQGTDSVTVTSTGSITDAGSEENTYAIDWGDTNPDNYNIAENLGTLTVKPADLTISTGSAEKTYDGSALKSSSFEILGLQGTDSVTVTPTGSITDAGSEENTYAIDWGDTNPDNYNIEENLGTLTVRPAALTISTGSAEKTYDGEPLTSSDVDIDGLAEGETITVTPTGSIINVGTAVNSCTINWGLTKSSNYDLTQNLGTLTVNHASIKLTITTGSDEKTYDGSALTNSEASVTGLVGDDSVTVTATGTITDAGMAQNGYTIDWGGTDPENYKVVETLGTLTVNKAPLTIRTGSAEKIYDGTALKSGEVSVDGLAAGETVTLTADGSITDAGETDNTYTINWGSAKESNYTLSEQLGTLKVKPMPVTFDLKAPETLYSTYAWVPDGLTASWPGKDDVPAEEENKAYGMYELAFLEAVFALPQGKVTMKIPAVSGEGEHKLSPALTFTEGKESNYEISCINDTVKMETVELTIDMNCTDSVYNGGYYIPEGLTARYADGTVVKAVEELILDDSARAVGVEASFHIKTGTLTLRINGVKDAGTYTVEPYQKALTGVSVSFGYTNNTMVIQPAPLTIKTGSASKTYDGTALTSSEVEIEGLAAGETITVTPTGSITQVGSEENTCSIVWDTAKESNYDLTPVLGTLTVTKAEAELTITTPSSSKTYDGTPLVGGEATVSGLIGGDTVTVTATGTITDAGTAKNGYTIDWGETDSNNYTIVENLGTLTVNKAALTITTGSAEKTYDGTALTSSEANAAGLAAGETVTVTAAGSITDVGEMKNTYTIDWDSAKEGNYTLSEELGTLKVTPLSVSFDLKAPKTLDSTSAWVPEGLTVSWEGTEPAAAQEENKHSGVDDVPYLEAVFALPGGKVTMTIPSVSGEGEHTLEPVLDFTTGKASNYEITYVNRTVKMVKPELIVDMNCFEAVYFGGYLVPEGISAKYSDGTAAEAEEDFIYEEERVIGTEVLFHLKEGTLILRIHGVKDAGTYENIEPYETELIGEDVDITYTNNTMIITPAPLTITTGSAEKVYDGEELTNSEATIDGLADGETITVTPTGSITDQGEAENTYTIDWGSVKESNYTLNEALGKLTVTPLPVTFNLYLPERLYFTDPFVPVEVLTASWPDGPETDAESVEIYGEGPSAYAEAVFTLPEGKVTMTIPAISGEGDHKVEPTLNFTEGKASNYAFGFVNNETKMGLPEVTIDMGGRQVEYGSVFAPEMKAILEDGTEVTPDVTDLTDAREYTFTINTDEYYSEVTLKFKKVTDAGTHTLTPDEVSQSVTEVKLIYKNNTWIINPAPLTIQTGAAEKVYDGTALTNSEVTVTGDVLEQVDFSSVKITANGSITDVGEADNTYTIDWGEEKEGNFTITDELEKLKVTPLPVTIDLNAPETLSTTDPWIPEGVTLSCGGSKYDPEEETVVGSPGEEEYYLKDVFVLPGGKVTVETPAVSGEGTHTLNPELTFASGNKKSNYDISYTNKTVKMGAAMSPLGFSASFMAKRPAAASSGMEMLTAGARAITDTLSTEAAAMAGKETDQAGKAAAASEAAGKAASEGKEQDVQNDAAPDQTSEGEGFTDTDVLSADGEEKVQSQDPDPEEDQTAEEGGEEKKTPEPEVPGDRAPAQAEPVEEKEEKPSLPEKPADKEPAPTPAPAEPVSAEPAEADSKQ